MDGDGDGIETSTEHDGAPILFDQDGDGVKTGTGWLKPDDGWLVHDLNGNGTIDNGGELFGVDTLMPDGTYAPDGFTALSQYDANGDGEITAADPEFSNLMVWHDLNQDGISLPDGYGSGLVKDVTPCQGPVGSTPQIEY